MKEIREMCPNCKKNGLAEELLFIPLREGRKQYLCCVQCNREYPCDNSGKRKEPKRMICY
jgi:hypothetical protein